MPKLSITIGLICVGALIVGCSFGPRKTYTITGEYIRVGEANETASDFGKTAVAGVTDLSVARVVVAYESPGKHGVIEVVELASGAFKNGKVLIEGKIDIPTEVEIFVQIDKDQKLATETLLVPGGKETTFALLDYETTYPPDQLVLVGTSRRAKDPSRKFTVIGDTSAVTKKDLSLAIASVDSTEYDESGNLQRVNYGSVLLRDDNFLIEADITEATTVSISVESGWEFRSYTAAIVEPGSEIKVVSQGAPDTMEATDKPYSRHSELIESWQQSDEYVSKMNEYIAAWEKQQEELEQQSSAETKVVSGGIGGTSVDSSEESVASESQEELHVEVSETTTETRVATVEGGETNDTDQTLASELRTLPAQGCEHVPLDEVVPSIRDLIGASSGYNYPEWVLLRQELEKIRSQAYDQFALNFDDPMNSLLALELGAFAGLGRDDHHLALPIYDKLARVLDEDLVARRVTRPRNALAQRLAAEQNDDALVPGQKAPLFTLPDLNGTQVALRDVLHENELVMIDFWASWCGPCIATFPHLKRLYAAFNESGFEIIVISIDDTFEDWEQASVEQQLPWLNIADLGGFQEETPISYGVQFIPKAYLLDSKGCILQKDLEPDKIQEVLIVRYGDFPELHEIENDPGPSSSPNDDEDLSG